MRSPSKRDDVQTKYDVVLDFPNLELHSAAASGNVGLVHYALTHGQPVNSVLHGVLPLHAACSGGSVSVVRMLIESGADVNAPRLPRRYSDGKRGTAPSVGTAGSTPLHFAAANGHAPIVQILLACGGDPTKPDKNGNTPENLAEINGHENVLHVLRAWQHIKDQEAPLDSARSDRADPGSPSASTSRLPYDDDDESVRSARHGFLPSRKGKERAFSFASALSNRSDGGLRVKKGIDAMLKRTTGGAGDSSPISTTGNDSPRSNISGPLPQISIQTDETTGATESDQLVSPNSVDDLPGSPSPQKGSVLPLTQQDTGDDSESFHSLTRNLSGQSASSGNLVAVNLGSPPRVTNFGPPPTRHRGSQSSRRPSLPSIIEKAVHPGAAFRAAIRHHQSDRDSKSPEGSPNPASLSEESSPPHSGGGSFFRGRQKHNEHKQHHATKHHTIFGLFRRGHHSPQSRSPSPPGRSDSGKVIAAEEMEEGIERLKRASLEIDRKEGRMEGDDENSIDLNDDEPAYRPVPASAPPIKTKFFLDSQDALLAPRMPPRRVVSDGETSPLSPTGDRSFNRPRTGSEVISPSPLANEWARDSDSDSAPTHPIRRVRTEFIRSASGSSSPKSPLVPSPSSPRGTKPRSATLPSGLAGYANGSRVVGLGWDDGADLRKVAASSIIRRESEKRRQEEEQEQELEQMEVEGDADEFHDAVDLDDTNEELGDLTPTASFGKVEDVQPPTPPSPPPSATLQQDTLPVNRLRGASVGSMTSNSSRLSTPPASLRMSQIEDADGSRNQQGSSVPVLSVTDGRPRGISVSSTSSGTSGMGYSFMPTASTPATSLTPPSVLSIAGLPYVPEHEAVVGSHPVPRRTLTSRTISSLAEAHEVVKQNESDILQLAQMPFSLDSSRSLAAQLAAYGENHAIEQELEEQERRAAGGSSFSQVGSEDGESFFSAESRSNISSGRSSNVTRSSGTREVKPRSLSGPHSVVPLVNVDAPRSSVPSINSIYDKRAAAYRDRLAALTTLPPLVPPTSPRHGRRQRAATSHEMWLDAGPKNRPGSILSSRTAGSEAGDFEEVQRYPFISNPMPVISNPVTGQRARKTSSASSTHSRHHTVPRSASIKLALQLPTPVSANAQAIGSAPSPIADVLSTRFQGMSTSPPSSSSWAGGNGTVYSGGGSSKTGPPSLYGSTSGSVVGTGTRNSQQIKAGTGLSPSPYISIFSHKYASHPLNEDSSDDEEQERGHYTVIENDWRGGHIVRPEALNQAAGGDLGGKKKWGLKKIGGLGRK